MVFVVRDDDGGSKLLFQTSDTTWQAYNTYGGNSFYNGAPAGRAYKVSYNRPFTTRCCEFPDGSTQSWLFDAEYPMVRWLERNGYDVSYSTGVDTDRRGAELLEHKVFLSVGHDEYWSAGQRTNVEAARAAGVHLGLFSGNLGFWKTRWESSIDGSGTTYRTLVCYKETQANAKIDPQPGVWTGTWRDPRFGPHDGGRPENALNGSLFMVNGIRNDTPTVPAADGKMRFWRNTSIATLAAGQTATLPTGILGFEWDEDLDNGSQPPGVVRLSSTTIPGANVLADYGSTYVWGPATHHLTLYRHSSGALVFGAGTIQWSWGLDDVHDYPGPSTDPRMQQATVNLLADMGVQPATLQSGLSAATASTDTTAPTATITAPANGASLPTGTPVTVSGTASDVGGQVGGVEVSTDGGATWHAATGRSAWSYQWVPATAGSATLRARAVDDSGNLGTASGAVTVTIFVKTCPCSLWSDSTVPAQPAVNDPVAVELGVKFTTDVAGVITGIRFYKGPGNTGTHTGRLWTSTGTLLGSVTFSGETATGWQSASFASPIAVSANTTYIASYHTPAGNYAFNADYFGSSPGSVVSPPLRAPASSVSGGNGVYQYGPPGSFPTDTYGSTNYWVDVVFVDGTATTTTTTSTTTTTTTAPPPPTTTTAPTTTTTLVVPTTTTSTTTTSTTTSTSTTSTTTSTTSTTTSTTTTSTSTTTTSTTTTTTTTTSTTTTTFPAGTGIIFSVPGFVQETVASGLPFATGIAFAPDGRMFIALKGGVVRVYQDGALLPTPFLDITAQVANSNDRGLLGIAVHPDFPATPYLYLLYTWNPPGYANTAGGGRVSRLIRVTADAAQGYDVATAGSDQPQTVAGGPGHVVLLGTNSTAANIGNPTDGRDTSTASCMTGRSMAGAPIEDCLPSDEDSHSIGTVMFGLDGALFVGSGDGSNYTGVDPRALRAQNVDSLAGKLMRLDPVTGLRAGGQSVLRRELPVVQPLEGLRAGSAQPVPLHPPSHHQRAVHRRRGLEHVGGDRHRQGRQLRLAVLRGRRRGQPGAGRERHHQQHPAGQLRHQPRHQRRVRGALSPGAGRGAGAGVLVQPQRHRRRRHDGRRVRQRRLVLHGHGVSAAVPAGAVHPRLQPALDPLPDVRRAGEGDGQQLRPRGHRRHGAGADRPRHQPLRGGAGGQRQPGAPHPLRGCGQHAAEGGGERDADHRHRAAGGDVLEPRLVRSRRPAAGLRLGLRRRRHVDGAESGSHLCRLRRVHGDPHGHRADGAVRVEHRAGRDHGGQRAAHRARHGAAGRDERTRSTTSSPTPVRAPPAGSRSIPRSCRGSCASITTSTSTTISCRRARGARSRSSSTATTRSTSSA